MHINRLCSYFLSNFRLQYRKEASMVCKTISINYHFITKHPVGDDLRLETSLLNDPFNVAFNTLLLPYIYFVVTFVWNFCHFVSTDKFDIIYQQTSEEINIAGILTPHLCGYTPLYFTGWASYATAFVCFIAKLPTVSRFAYSPIWRLWLWSFVVLMLHTLSTIGIAYGIGPVYVGWWGAEVPSPALARISSGFGRICLALFPKMVFWKIIRG